VCRWSVGSDECRWQSEAWSSPAWHINVCRWSVSMSMCAGELSAVMSAADRVKPEAHLAHLSICAGEVSACQCAQVKCRQWWVPLTEWSLKLTWLTCQYVQVKCQHVDVCRWSVSSDECRWQSEAWSSPALTCQCVQVKCRQWWVPLTEWSLKLTWPFTCWRSWDWKWCYSLVIISRQLQPLRSRSHSTRTISSRTFAYFVLYCLILYFYVKSFLSWLGFCVEFLKHWRLKYF